jgi:GDP/UDP-N,N'-diacetylbacillosamine 2-epimerase (hydrolysing)
MIDDYVTNHDNTISFTSMGQLNYLSALQFVDAVVGNSSSGLLEAPSFKIVTINVGDRQSGRIQAESVINCDPNSESIALSIKKIYTTSFQKKLLNTVNPYEQKNSSGKILQIIKNFNITNIIKKKFHDIQT